MTRDVAEDAVDLWREYLALDSRDYRTIEEWHDAEAEIDQRAETLMRRSAVEPQRTCGTCAHWREWPDGGQIGDCAHRQGHEKWSQDDGCRKGWTPKETP
jgi:hypothetical protein